MNQQNLDRVGRWSEMKLEIIKKYAAAYATILSQKSEIRRFAYVDAFAGAGHHISKESGELIDGSPAIALSLNPGFDEYHFIDLDGTRIERLRTMYGNRADVHIYHGDCNATLIDNVFPRCRYADFARGLCLLDPYGLTVNWKVVEAAGQSKSIEIFYNFMVMDANMNVLLRNPDKLKPAQAARMTAMGGDESWKEAAYVKSRGLFGELEEKSTNDRIAKALQNRLRKVAGFAYVSDPLPMKNSTGAVVYYLYFASSNKNGAKIANDIFRKYRN